MLLLFWIIPTILTWIVGFLVYIHEPETHTLFGFIQFMGILLIYVSMIPIVNILLCITFIYAYCKQ